MPPALPQQEAEEKAFWTSLCPTMTIEADDDDARLTPPEQAVQRGLAQLREEGYFRLEGVLPEAQMAAMAAAVCAVTARCGLPVFALVYDAFWALPRRLSGLVERTLGGAFSVLPDCWIWQLATTPDDAGWRPHRDRDHGTIDEDGTPQIISLWVPLTDATPENGCIYVLPATRDPHYHRHNPEGHSTIQALQDIRALPAKAGSVLCWTHQLLHWGGRSSRYAAQPRISVAFELQRREVPAFATPLLDPFAPPDFVTRLGLIGRILLQYQNMMTLPPDMVALAKQLRTHLPGQRSFASVLARLLPARKG